MLAIIATIPFVLGMPGSIQAETVSVSAKAGLEKINAIEGTIVLPANVTVENIYTGDSVVLIWVVSPTIDSANHTVTFAGITPGGFSGEKPLFILETSSGKVAVAGGKLTGYRNDGKGTPIQLEYALKPFEIKTDSELPEPFKLAISSSKQAFDGRPFLSFSAQDKGTGIVKYEFASTWLFGPKEDDWSLVQPPRALTTLELFKRLHIRATDARGNARVVSTGGTYWPITFVFSLIMLLCVLLLLKRSFRSHSS